MDERELQINDQVVLREKLTNRGSDVTRVRTGTVLGFKDDDKKIAIIAMQDNPKAQRAGITARREVAVDQLQPVQKVFGRAVVQVNPAFRTIARLKQF